MHEVQSGVPADVPRKEAGTVTSRQFIVGVVIVVLAIALVGYIMWFQSDQAAKEERFNACMARSPNYDLSTEEGFKAMVIWNEQCHESSGF